jgi:hypothetical protein
MTRSPPGDKARGMKARGHAFASQTDPWQLTVVSEPRDPAPVASAHFLLT